MKFTILNQVPRKGENFPDFPDLLFHLFCFDFLHLKIVLLFLSASTLILYTSLPPTRKKVLRIFDCVLPTKGKHFYSSSESEEEEESHKKFNIKIKPLQSKDILKNAATVDELKASIGNIALSPSPVVSGFVCQALMRLNRELCSAHVCEADQKLLKLKAAYGRHFLCSVNL